MKQFPEIILSEKLKAFNNNYKIEIEKDLISKLEKPIYPTEPIKLKRPETPEKFGLHVFFIPLFPTGFVFVISEYNIFYTVLTYIGVIIFILLLFSNENKEYKKKISEFKGSEDNFPKLLKKYETEKIEFQNEEVIFKSNCEEIRKNLENKTYLHKQRLKYIAEKKMLCVLKPSIYYENINKGKTENIFLKFLNDIFPNEIFTDKVIEIFEYQDYDYYDKNSNAYVPDFLFVHEKSDLVIDIEIDEPYYEDKAIHCIYEPHDEKRNNYFTKFGLVVIRFSEEQIKNNPMECCKEIAYLIFYFTGDYSYYKKLENVERIYRHKKWSHKEAEYLMKINFRDMKNAKFEDVIKKLPIT